MPLLQQIGATITRLDGFIEPERLGRVSLGNGRDRDTQVNSKETDNSVHQGVPLGACGTPDYLGKTQVSPTPTQGRSSRGSNRRSVAQILAEP